MYELRRNKREIRFKGTANQTPVFMDESVLDKEIYFNACSGIPIESKKNQMAKPWTKIEAMNTNQNISIRVDLKTAKKKNDKIILWLIKGMIE